MTGEQIEKRRLYLLVARVAALWTFAAIAGGLLAYRLF